MLSCDHIENMDTLDKLPKKLKYLRGNQQPFMNKEHSKAIMIRSRLKNCYLRNQNDSNRAKYTKQRDYCVNLRRRVKRDYYNSLNINNINDNKNHYSCWKGGVIINNGKVANDLNNFFSNIVDLLKIPENFKITNTSNHIEDNVEKAIVEYNKHPSILQIKEKRTTINKFILWHTKIDVITEIILSMGVNKASPNDDIPLKIIKNNYDIFAPLLCNDFNLDIVIIINSQTHLKVQILNQASDLMINKITLIIDM